MKYSENLSEFLPSYEAKVKTTLIDAETNEVISEEIGHNDLTPHAKRYMAAQFREPLVRNLPGWNNYGQNVQFPFIFDEPLFPFDLIILGGDPVGSEKLQRESSAPYDQIVGFARKTSYTGTDTKRGSLDTSSTKISKDKIKLGFIWNTHAANGTITGFGLGTLEPRYNMKDNAYGVGTSSSTGSDITASNFRRITSFGEYIEDFGFETQNLVIYRKENGEKVFIASSGSTVYVFDKDMKTIFSFIPTSGGTPSSLALANDILIVCVNEYIKGYRINKETGIVDNSTTVFNKATSNQSYTGYVRAVYSEGNIYFSTSTRVNDNSSFVGYPLQDFINLQSIVWENAPIKKNIYNSKLLSGVNYANILAMAFNEKERIWYFNISGTYILTLNEDLTEANLFYPQDASIRQDQILYFEDDMYAVRLGRFLYKGYGPSGMGTKVQLENPITKTNKQLLKIEYEITIK